jgi:hypothetical protein
VTRHGHAEGKTRDHHVRLADRSAPERGCRMSPPGQGRER